MAMNHCPIYGIVMVLPFICVCGHDLYRVTGVKSEVKRTSEMSSGLDGTYMLIEQLPVFRMRFYNACFGCISM